MGIKRVVLKQYRRRLIEMGARLKNDESGVMEEALRQAGSGTSGNLSNVPMHLADLSTDAFEQEMSASLMTNVRQTQIEVAEALDRIESGTFGACEQCRRDIGEARLHAVPYTRYCVECAQNAENEGEAGFRPTLL
ncbi:MAG TPA: TraR/DksA C4-type zinc finger protein [Gemmataceae bacterium]|nr:TraR/DksA C4-type zinc finger protein [Gemmataceae bacterium]